MKVHQPDLIEAIIKLQASGTQERYELGSLYVEYGVIHIPEEDKPFPLAVAAAFPEVGSRTPGAIAVSDDVPPHLRGLWAMHELHDFTVVGHEARQRCIRTESYLLRVLEQADQSGLAAVYAAARGEFMDNVGAYMERDISERGADDSQYHQFDVEGCAATSLMLRAYVARI
jgi:hypothetical protein